MITAGNEPRAYLFTSVDLKEKAKYDLLIMSDISSSYDEIAVANEVRGQGLKHLPHWPPVNIAFEDVIYTVENAVDSKYNVKFLIYNQ